MLKVGALLILVVGVAACEPNNQGYAPAQPIVYSHAVHAGELQIPCQYCHFGAERGRYAGIPPASVCMNCHKQVRTEHPEVQKIKAAIDSGTPIPWARVHWLPDHVYFNHSAHVVSGGIVCQTCHGPVEEMGRVEQWAPLTMGWCLSCHRGNAPEDVQATAVSAQANRLTDCATCHH